MEYTVEHDQKTGVLTATIIGEVFFREVVDLVKWYMTEGKFPNAELLVADLRKADLPMTAFDLYRLSKALGVIFSTFGYRYSEFKRAFVISEDSEAFTKYESMIAKEGHSFKVFLDIDEAKQWVLSA